MRWIDHWRYVTQSRRNLPLDLLRGYCVVVMTIDHAGMFPTWIQGLTGAAQLWVTAAEGFFIVAGLAFGMVYQRYLTERGANWTIGHLARRAGRLYLLSVIGHWLLATGDFVLRLFVNRPTDLPQDYGQVIEGALLQLRVAPGSFGMLAVYALLLPLGLGALYLLRRGHWRWVLIGSIGLWYAARLDPAAFTLIQTYFNAATWQVLFIFGVIVGVYRAQLSRWWAQLPARRITIILVDRVGGRSVGHQLSDSIWRTMAGRDLAAIRQRRV